MEMLVVLLIAVFGAALWALIAGFRRLERRTH
ncbi:unnamed protein product, partial [marine sediment metagenome]